MPSKAHSFPSNLDCLRSSVSERKKYFPAMPVTGTGGNITGPDSNQTRIWFVANLYWQLLIISVKVSHIENPEQFSCLAF